MTQDLLSKIDTRKYPDVGVHPRLITILQELSHHNPELTYEAIDTTSYYPDGKRITEVAVRSELMPVGKIEVAIRSHSSHGSEPVYRVYSENIVSGRRRRGHMKETKHLKIAMKIIKDAFQPSDLNTLAKVIIEGAQGKLERMVSWARDHARGVVVNAHLPILEYLTLIDSGKYMTPALPPTLKEAMGGKWQEYLGNMRVATAVANSFRTKQGILIRIEQDETLRVVDIQSATLTMLRSTYDLPTNYQEKLTMLKLMDESQPIEHVGVKFSDYDHVNGVRVHYDLYFLVAGDTYTNC